MHKIIFLALFLTRQLGVAVQRKTNVAGDKNSINSSLREIKVYNVLDRAHDNCYPQIAPGECLKSICNHGSFTRLHCGEFRVFYLFQKVVLLNSSLN